MKHFLIVSASVASIALCMSPASAQTLPGAPAESSSAADIVPPPETYTSVVFENQGTTKVVRFTTYNTNSIGLRLIGNGRVDIETNYGHSLQIRQFQGDFPMQYIEVPMDGRPRDWEFRCYATEIGSGFLQLDFMNYEKPIIPSSSNSGQSE